VDVDAQKENCRSKLQMVLSSATLHAREILREIAMVSVYAKEVCLVIRIKVRAVYHKPVV
tara:strand:+ start:365 stop:544 length:180 start_codon:yes stop_codon:yes gene_type:complete